MALIDANNIRHLAHLSRLTVTEQKIDGFVRDLEAILQHCKKLEAIDTRGIEPVIGALNLKNIMRADDCDPRHAASAADETELITRAFPDREGNALKVPKIL